MKISDQGGGGLDYFKAKTSDFKKCTVGQDGGPVERCDAVEPSNEIQRFRPNIF
jgi:hypothetical protein